MKITFEYWDGTISAEDAANELERIAGMIRDGYYSGELINGAGNGWWSTEGEFEEESA